MKSLKSVEQINEIFAPKRTDKKSGKIIYQLAVPPKPKDTPYGIWKKTTYLEDKSTYYNEVSAWYLDVTDKRVQAYLDDLSPENFSPSFYEGLQMSGRAGHLAYAKILMIDMIHNGANIDRIHEIYEQAKAYANTDLYKASITYYDQGVNSTFIRTEAKWSTNEDEAVAWLKEFISRQIEWQNPAINYWLTYYNYDGGRTGGKSSQNTRSSSLSKANSTMASAP